MTDLHIIGNEPLIVQKINVPQQLHDPYRWYLCTETKTSSWSCWRTEAEKALTHVSYEGEHTRAIMIWKPIPRIFDPLILHKRLHPHVKISM